MGSAVSFVRSNACMAKRCFSNASKCEISPYCPARHPDCDSLVKYEPRENERSSGVPRKVDIEETKRKIQQYYAAINDLDKHREGLMKVKQAEENSLKCLDTRERHRRVKRKPQRMRRERMKFRDKTDALQRHREDRLTRYIHRREALLDEMYELRRRNRELEMLVLERTKEPEKETSGPISSLKKFLEDAWTMVTDKWESLKKLMSREEPNCDVCEIVSANGANMRPTCAYKKLGQKEVCRFDKAEEEGPLRELVTDAKLPFLANLLQKFETGRKDRGL